MKRRKKQVASRKTTTIVHQAPTLTATLFDIRDAALDATASDRVGVLHIDHELIELRGSMAEGTLEARRTGGAWRKMKVKSE